MAMFDKHRSSKSPAPVAPEPKASPAAPTLGASVPVTSSRVAMIGQGISIKGEVRAENSLKIEGRVEGRAIQCSEEVEIAEAGQVTANIMARVVKISGLVMGDIVGGEKVLITRTGRVQGNIVAPRVQLEDGALFRGSIDMDPPQKAEPEKPAATRPAAPARPESTGNGQKMASPAAAKGQPAVSDAARKEPSLNLKSG